jgi:hypothetical protein
VNGFLARFLATRSGILTSAPSSSPCQTTFDQSGTLPYHPRAPWGPWVRSFGARLESRVFSARNHLTSELLRTL